MMLKRFFFGLLWMLPCYFVGLFGCLWLLPYLTANTHDAGVEAAMTGAFVFGPAAALLGFVIGFARAKPKTDPTRDSPETGSA